MIHMMMQLPILICLMVILTWSAPAKSGEVATELRQRLDQRVAKSGLKKEELGLLAILHEEGQSSVVLEAFRDRLMIPASLTKILTAGMSLEKYPPGHKFYTDLLSDGKIDETLLRGDLYLKGGGDPGFVSESMWFLVNEFYRTGVKKIDGDIIVDDTRFDGERFHEGRDPSRVDRAYDAPIGAMSFNWNSINIYVRPAAKSGLPAKVFADPENSYITVINKTTTGKSGSRKDLRAERKANGANGDTIIVDGSLAVDAPEAVIYKGILQPDVWSGTHLRAFLQRRGIVVTGEVKTGATPPKAALLARAESKPISQLVTDMMKFSNNYVAEMLTKNLAVENKGEPGTMTNGLKSLGDYLVEKGFKDKFEITSPSGLSRANRLTPAHLHRVLEDLRKNFSVFSEFISSLPIAGIDGTLKSRMEKPPAKGWVRAKTGLLTGVAGLAGYAGRPDGGQVTFVFLYNGRPDHTVSARDLFDQLATELVQ
ncbi:MAG: D-alanyl-D-alanine carboxypeptidase/D-alanyl-D-alanine-endopeptidase [Bdellovibrionales bacterium]|nr:D-alanyl-D-alanine carboxypeptidase/D-alanyl-D-alanine-endopeptidase [Bdellovibrionales bacterium]